MLLKNFFPLFSKNFRCASFSTASSSIETYKITASNTPQDGTRYVSGKTNTEFKIGNALETVLATLSGCENSTACYYAKTLGIEIRNISFQVEADYDTSRFIDANSEEPNIFSQIRMKVEVETDGTQEDVEKLREVVAKHSPIQNMLIMSGVDLQSDWTKVKKKQ